MKLKLLSPDKVHYDGEVDSVSVPCMNYRDFTILNNHGPVIAALDKGVVKYVSKDKENMIEISSGFVDVRNNEIIVCIEL